MTSTRGRFAALLLLAAPLCSACRQASVVSNPSQGEQLLGRWEWQGSTTAHAPAQTPASTGHRVVVEFDRRGRARFYEDDTFRSASAFSVRHELPGLGRPGRHVLRYRGYRGSQLYSVSGNTLQLREVGISNALEHRYTRVQH